MSPTPGGESAEPEWRQCPITHRWVTIAPSRALRPHDFRHASHDSQAVADEIASCPFCAGHEHETPAEVAVIYGPSNWQVRTVRNKYPAVNDQLSLTPWQRGMSSGLTGFGLHDVIVESPRHIQRTGDLSDSEFASVLEMYRRRLLDLRQDERLKYGLLFKNVGPEAGASLEHLHSQLVGLPMIPAAVQEELTGSEQYYSAHGRCVYCDLIATEETLGERLVKATNDFVAFCPAASRFGWETWVLPRRHADTFELSDASQVPQLAAFLHDVLARVEATLPRCTYNYYIHSAPFATQDLRYYHWHIEITPRVYGAAGFEWGTGFAINPTSPEQAAESLRRASG